MEEEQDPYKKLELIEQIQAVKLEQRAKILRTFLISDPSAKPFPEQVAFFKDRKLYKLLRCGNRSAKTYSSMRELAWIITRSHWYRQDYNVLDLADKKWKNKLGSAEYETEYLKSKPKLIWLNSPTFDFLNNTQWGEYLSKMIPEWFIKDIKYTNQKNLEKIFFRNGDVIECKSYAQADLSKMGRSCDLVFLDEMPGNLNDITELVVRTFDKSGTVTLAFTPLVQNNEIRNYLDSGCENGDISLHSWSVLANPHYRDNPERKARVIAEYAHLSEAERGSRLRGDWYYETPGEAVFAGVKPELVDDFVVPKHWRRMRVTDPASYTSGHAEFCEDPSTGIWYLYLGLELTWKEAVKAEILVQQIEAYKPYASFKYFKSLFDNSEQWFYSYAASVGYRGCILKNREDAIMKTRDAIASGKLKFFKNGGRAALVQFNDYHFNDKGTGIVKARDHILDCIMYFCREIPKHDSANAVEDTTEQAYIMKKHMAQLAKKGTPRHSSLFFVPTKYVQGFNRRGAR